MRSQKNIIMMIFSAIVLLFSACVEVDSIPTKPDEANVKLATHVGDWRDEVIYQVITDRFYDGDVNNNFNVDTRTLGRYHGGDWQGIIDKLDYLEELGVTALWISPVVKNVEEDADFASYHGYWTQDFLKHNPHFGNLADLRRLSDALHKRGMKLILDIVTNHVGQVFFYDINMNGTAQEWLSGSGAEMPGNARDKYRCVRDSSGKILRINDKGELVTDADGQPILCNVSDLSRVTEFDPDWQPQGIQAFTSMGLAGAAPIVFFDMPRINRVAPGPRNIDLNGDGQITTSAERLGFANPDWYHKRGRVFDWDSQFDKDGNLLRPPYQHRLTLADGNAGPFIDGKARDYYQNDQTLLADFPGGLKDIATERDDVRAAMIKVFSYWIDVTDCDGFRIDTLKHVEYSFWETFAPAIREHALKRGKKNFFMFGEAFDGNDDLLAAYTQKDMVDSVFLFSQKYAIDNVFKCAPGNNAPYCKGQSFGTSNLYGWKTDTGRDMRVQKYGNVAPTNGVTDSAGVGLTPRQLLVNFLDNHDVGRYLFDRQDEKGVKSLMNALNFLLTTNGIPCLYYGTEQGFFGGNDPANRENVSNLDASIYLHKNYDYSKTEAWDRRNPLFLHIKELLEIRKAVPALRRGTYDVLWHSENKDNEADAGIFVYARKYEGKSAIIVVNTHEQSSKETRGSVGDGMMDVSSYFGQTNALVDLLDPGYKLNVNAGKVIVSVPSMKTRILVPQADKASYGL
ncbi:MAG: alpha-amylase family glycosyl hydrolase [Bradymonadales bacterium]|jgi:alpha-amylase